MSSSRILLLDVGGRLDDMCSPDRPVARILSHRDDITLDAEAIATGLDGSDVGPQHWTEIARHIRDVYEQYDGFVVWHPTDTLAYTASALSFICENLAKPIVVSGGMLPIDAKRTDASHNLANAILIAASRATGVQLIPEVVVCFGSSIFRGSRCRKVSSQLFAGFDSPNFPPLGDIGEHIRIRTELIRPVPEQSKRFAINEQLSDKIMDISLFPGLKPSHLRQMMLDIGDIEAFVLRTFGAGNIPNSEAFTKVISDAATKGKIVLNVAQTHSGGVNGFMYGADPPPEVINGSDLTPEAAFAKLSVTLGRGLATEHVRQLLHYDLRGEQSDTRGRIEELWLPNQSLVPAIALVKEINTELIRYLRNNPKKMHDLTSRAFEKLIAELFKHHGYEVALTPETRDGGYDFRALLIDGLGTPFLSYVEAKRYSPDNPVSVEVVRSLYGVVSSSNVSRGIIVTSSRFTSDARKFQANVMDRMTLHDYNDIKHWLENAS